MVLIHNKANIISSETKDKNLYRFPCGVLGMKRLTEFYLLVRGDEAPFYWMVSKTEDVSFLLVSPFLFRPDYVADISETDVKELCIEEEKDAVIAVIVNRKQGFTANFVAPVLFNQRKNMGRQVILFNYKKYNVRTPLKLPTEGENEFSPGFLTRSS